MKFSRIASFLAVLLATGRIVSGQAFQDLNFEGTPPKPVVITPVLINSATGFYDYIATVPGWTWSPLENAAGVNVGTTVSLNSVALDDAAVTLQGTNSPFAPAIQGKYSIFLQGSSPYDSGNKNSASIGQTGTIPVSAKSITYWGAALQVTFNGQPLLFTDVSDTPNYTIWSADISSYAGQTGQLLFAAPYETSGLLDNIQFSVNPVPEPSTLSLFGVGILFLCWRRKPTVTHDSN